MMNKINKILEKNKSKNFDFYKCYQYTYYLKHRKVLKTFLNRPEIKTGSKEFDIICKNAVISAVLNKNTLDNICKDLFSSIYLTSKLTFEEFLKYYHARIVDLRFFRSLEKDIYIPIYSHVLNDIYLNNPLELLKQPYSEVVDNLKGNYIDPFSTYNYKLFDSTFTKLIKIKEYKSGVAFYDFDCATIFFINEQGRLDYYLPIFDKWMKKINTSRLINRLLPVCDSYYEGTKDNIISELYNMSLISEKMKKILENKTL